MPRQALDKMSSHSAGNDQRPRSNKTLSNQALLDLITPTIPAVSKPKPSNRPPKFLEKIERRDPNGMINPAPPPLIRTEENDPTPPLADRVEALRRKTCQSKPLSKKMKIGHEQDGDPPTKAPSTTNRGHKIPETPAQAEKWDKMLWEKKIAGKGWMEIAEEWERLTDTAVEPKEEDTVSEKLRKRRYLIDMLSVRFCKLKESYAASGTLELPEFYRGAQPDDLKYRMISDRKKQDIKLFDCMEKTKAQMEDSLWKAFCRNYQEEYGEEISVADARRRYELLINGVAKLKPIAAEEKDMLEIKKEIIMDPVAVKSDDEE